MKASCRSIKSKYQANNRASIFSSSFQGLAPREDQNGEAPHWQYGKIPSLISDKMATQPISPPRNDLPASYRRLQTAKTPPNRLKSRLMRQKEKMSLSSDTIRI